jgi:hypothetical protein
VNCQGPGPEAPAVQAGTAGQVSSVHPTLDCHRGSFGMTFLKQVIPARAIRIVSDEADRLGQRNVGGFRRPAIAIPALAKAVRAHLRKVILTSDLSL